MRQKEDSNRPFSTKNKIGKELKLFRLNRAEENMKKEKEKKKILSPFFP